MGSVSFFLFNSTLFPLPSSLSSLSLHLSNPSPLSQLSSPPPPLLPLNIISHTRLYLFLSLSLPFSSLTPSLFTHSFFATHSEISLQLSPLPFYLSPPLFIHPTSLPLPSSISLFIPLPHVLSLSPSPLTSPLSHHPVPLVSSPLLPSPLPLTHPSPPMLPISTYIDLCVSPIINSFSGFPFFYYRLNFSFGIYMFYFSLAFIYFVKCFPVQ